LIKINEAYGAERNNNFHKAKEALTLIIHEVQQKNSKKEVFTATVTAKL